MNLSYSETKKRTKKKKTETKEEKKPVGRSAKDIYEVAKRIQNRNTQRSTEVLKNKCTEAVTAALKEGYLDVLVEMSDEDRTGMENVVEEMRRLGYRHCLIETQDEEGDVLGHDLRISWAHLG